MSAFGSGSTAADDDVIFCEHCGGPLTDGDRFQYFLTKERWAAGQVIDDLWLWLPDGNVVPVCSESPQGIHQHLIRS